MFGGILMKVNKKNNFRKSFNKKFLNINKKSMVAIILLLIMLATIILGAIIPFAYIVNAEAPTSLPELAAGQYSEQPWYLDVPLASSYADALNRLTVLGIFQGGEGSIFRPDDTLTREELAKLLIIASGLEKTVINYGIFEEPSYSGKNKFPDVPSSRWSSRYIRAAVEYGFMGGLADGNFHPTREVSYAEMCTILVKALGYTEQDLQGEWPVNYINQSIKLGLSEGLNFNRNDGLPRWAAAVMIDRLLETNIKNIGLSGENMLYSEYVGLYSKYIILADSNTSSRLADNQVQTDKGIFYISDDGGKKLEVGNEYQLKVEDDVIKNVYNKLRSTAIVRIDGYGNNKITYKEDGSNKINSMILSEKTTYYYNGIKQNYDNLRNILKKDMTVIFANNDDETGFLYAVIIDPEDYKFGTYIEAIILNNSKTSKKLASNQVLTDKGVYKLTDEVFEHDLRLELGATFGLIVNDDNEIVKISRKIKDTASITVESAVETRIIYKKNNNLSVSGTGTIRDSENIISSPVDSITSTMTLPEKIKYYYNGAEYNYEELKNILKKNTSIVFSYYGDKEEYEYAVLFDPIYSTPEKVGNVDTFLQRNRILEDVPAIRDGKFISLSQIKQNDIIYVVTDIWNNNKYLLVVDDSVSGEITDILPDKITPKTVQIDDVNYELGEYFDTKKLNHNIGTFNIGDNVIAFLDYDGKVFDIEYPGNENNSDFAIILNTYKWRTSDLKGNTNFTYSAKLLTTDGKTAIYDTVYDAESYKGKLVRIRDVNGKLVLSSVALIIPGNIKINKGERKVNSEYVADNVKIFNLISNEEGEEARAEILKFSELPDGEIPQGKVLYINRAGDFMDINVIMTSDIYNEKQKPAIVKEMNIIEDNNSNRKLYTYTLLAGDKEYQYNNLIGNAGKGSIVDIELSSKGIEKVGTGKKPEVTDKVIQAIDSKRIKIKDEIHWLKPRIYIYFIDKSGEITKRGIGNIEKNKLYESVSIYYDKDKDEGGKVEAIVVKE